MSDLRWVVRRAYADWSYFDEDGRMLTRVPIESSAYRSGQLSSPCCAPTSLALRRWSRNPSAEVSLVDHRQPSRVDWHVPVGPSEPDPTGGCSCRRGGVLEEAITVGVLILTTGGTMTAILQAL
jgi:hypothetical protein